MNGSVVHLFNFDTGSATATVDLGARRPFLAWGAITFTDSLAVYDRDNAGCVEVYQVDGTTQGSVASGGDHLGASGTDTNLRPGAVRGFGQRVTFRLRTFHVEDLSHYGVGCVLTLD